MDLDETSHILDHQHFPDTPDSTKSDLHHLGSALAEEEKEDRGGRSSLPAASFNFINSIIGSGIIGIPYALKEAGFGLGIVLIIIVSGFTDFSLTLLIHGGELSNTNTYQDMMRAAFGRPGFVALTIIQFLYPMIAMISYNVIIGDTITKIVLRIGGDAIRSTIVARREFVIVAVTLVFTLPLSLYRNITKLSKVSLASIALILIIILMMIGRGFTMDIPETPGAWQFGNSGVTRGIAIMAFSYMCHHNSFLIYDSLHAPSEKRWGTVTHASVAFSMACTLLLGITGYATFTGHTQGDVLENYCYKDDLMNVARVMFAFTIVLTYPIECFVCREVFENAIFAFEQPPPLWRHIMSSVVLVAFSVIVSMTTDCLGIVLELNGVLNAAPLAYIFPALCVMKLRNERLLSWNNLVPALTALFGILMAVTGFVMVCIELAQGVTCSHGEELAYCHEWDHAVGNGTSGWVPPVIMGNTNFTSGK